MSTITIKRALLSVSDKAGIVELAKKLHELNVHILSTGGTAKLLEENQIPVTEVAEHTGYPEMMGGRVKTLHPKIHGGLLGRRGIDNDVMQANDIAEIDLLVVNLYPFAATIAKQDCKLEDAIENIDIGGPAMLRSAAKNNQSVAVVTNPEDYASVVEELSETAGSLTAATRFSLARKAFAHTAYYDSTIAAYLLKQDEQSENYPQNLTLGFNKTEELRYGENPHQSAAFYTESNITEPSISTAKQLQGKALSYNNIADSDAALECVKQFAEPACVIVKHANPCGVAVKENILAAYQAAFTCDPTSAFGGIIAFNQTLDTTTAQTIIDKQFVEVIIAPAIADGVTDIIAAKKNVRLLVTGEWQKAETAFDYKRVNGGLLVQDRDLAIITANDLNIVTERKPSDKELTDCLFAWKVAKFVKSNAIVYGKDQISIGIGAGQMSRVYSAKIAGIKAADENLEVKGSVMASDAFFPFRDGIDAAHQAGITAVIQPGGSMRDQEVIDAANEHNMAMVFTGVRHFRH